MKLCDRCRVSGCCLNYLGDACKRVRQKECPDVVLTNADRIRDMSDEELAEAMKQKSIATICDIVCGGECNAMATLTKTSNQVCKEIILAWLRKSAEED